MSDKVYEMEDDYKEALADLLRLMELRERAAALIKFAPPDIIREIRTTVAELDKQIEESEALLASAYESYQKFRRLEEELEVMNEAMGEKMEISFIILKHHLPDKLAKAESTMFNGWSPEDIQDFYDRVAIREATQLEEILAGAKK